MDDVAAIDASPLIVLGAISRDDILKHAARRIVVPRSVVREVPALGADEAAARVLAASRWIESCDDFEPPPAIQAWDLGTGEAAVLTFAMRTPGAIAVIDDRAGRRCADALGVRVVGTVGPARIIHQASRLAEPTGRPLWRSPWMAFSSRSCGLRLAAGSVDLTQDSPSLSTDLSCRPEAPVPTSVQPVSPRTLVNDPGC